MYGTHFNVILWNITFAKAYFWNIETQKNDSISSMIFFAQVQAARASTSLKVLLFLFHNLSNWCNFTLFLDFQDS